MEQQFISAWMAARENCAKLGIRLRPISQEAAMDTAHRMLSGSRVSDGFYALAESGHLKWSLEALAVDKRFTGLFTDREADNALNRLLEAGYRFRR